MLVEFQVENFKAIHQRLTLSLVATDDKALEDSHVRIAPDGRRLLHSAVIFGGNGTGKSTLYQAFHAMERLVLTSATKLSHGQALPNVVPYAFQPNAAQTTTEFVVLFYGDNHVRYEYGFAATRERVVDEWLLAYPNGRQQTWIDRRWNANESRYEWGNTPLLKGEKKLWRDSTRENALFLSTAIQLNSEQLKPVYDWFLQRTQFIGDVPELFTAHALMDAEKRSDLLRLLAQADFTIADVVVRKEKTPRADMLAQLPAFMQEVLRRELPDEDEFTTFNIQTFHRGPDGNTYPLDFEEESDGTKKFFALLAPWLEMLEKGALVMVDELSNHLHPLLVRELVRMFHTPTLNSNGAQLIFTSHDPSLITPRLFRRDQILFMDKNEYSQVSLSALNDFGARKDEENWQARYLAGLYAGVPVLSELSPKPGA